jgi:hypothetical protein
VATWFYQSALIRRLRRSTPMLFIHRQAQDQNEFEGEERSSTVLFFLSVIAF